MLRTLRPCTQQPCPEFVTHGRCLKHQRATSRRKDLFSNRERVLYSGPRWRATRAAKLKRDPYCEECIKGNRFIAAQEVDHVVPIDDGGPIWDDSNLQSLCKTCHSRKTIAEVRAKYARKTFS